MKHVAFAVLATALLAAPLAPHAAAGGVVVHLQLSAGSHLAPAYKTCDVVVAPGADGGDVLDAATAQGCISGWEHDASFGPRFVTCIDGLCQQSALLVGTFWGFYVDEQLPCGGACGIDDVSFHGGETAEFAYVDWYTPFTLPL